MIAAGQGIGDDWVVLERVPGVPLVRCWPGLTTDERQASHRRARRGRSRALHGTRAAARPGRAPRIRRSSCSRAPAPPNPLLAGLERARDFAYVDRGCSPSAEGFVRALRPVLDPFESDHAHPRRPPLPERPVGRRARERPARPRVRPAGAGRPRPRRLPAVLLLPVPVRPRGPGGRGGASEYEDVAVLVPRRLPELVRPPAAVRPAPPLRHRLRREGPARRTRRGRRSTPCRPTTRTGASSTPSVASPTSTRSPRAEAVLQLDWSWFGVRARSVSGPAMTDGTRPLAVGRTCSR